MARLPRFIPPMLAKIGSPFDDPEWIFEIKWDGTRALAFAERSELRLVNRKGNAVRERYPELGELARLPAGTVVDGEITVMENGRPSFRGMLQREQARDAARFRALAAALPAVYVAFDLLWKDGAPVTDWPLADRRAALRDVLAPVPSGVALFSDGIVGEGCATFEQACARELEGVMAKRLSSRYLPGKRTDAWLKIKRTQHTLAAILGFLPEGEKDFRSLVIALEDDGNLVPAGRVGSGLDDATRATMAPELFARVTHEPVVDVPRSGPGEVRWVEPGLYCEVKFLERTPDGLLRAPVFVRMVPG
jgi:bifunctional non-homologous end joining protein LigD